MGSKRKREASASSGSSSTSRDSSREDKRKSEHKKSGVAKDDRHEDRREDRHDDRREDRHDDRREDRHEDRHEDRREDRREDRHDDRRDRYKSKREAHRNDRDNREWRDRRDERLDRDSRGRRDYDRNSGNRDRGRNNRENNRRRRSRSASFDHSKAKWGNNKSEKKEPGEKQKPSFALSGKLTEETNTYRGVVIKYSEPPEAKKPKRRWRLYPFKGDKALQTLYIHRDSAYLIGRDRKVVDLPVDHPSCSKQHAALQYRLVPFTRDDGSAGKKVRPYLIDLESANGTFINNKKIEPKKYVELLERDVIKFGFSSREYVLLHENSKDEAQDDDVKVENETVKEEVKQETD